MNYLHKLHVIHADIKAVNKSLHPLCCSLSLLVAQANILIGDDGKVLLADFGISKVQNQLTIKRRTSNDGTPRWMAPELLDGGNLDLPCDVYSFAITTWELYTGKIPFSNVPDTAVPHVVVDMQHRPNRPASLFNDALWLLIEKCWQPDPLKRPTFSTIHADIKPMTSPSMADLIIYSYHLTLMIILARILLPFTAEDATISSGLLNVKGKFLALFHRFDHSPNR
jgi:serine/threonine protein kinase